MRVEIVARRSGTRRGGFEGCSEQGADVVETCFQGGIGHRVTVEQAGDQGHVGEVRQQRAITGEQQLLGIVAPESPGVHLALEIGRSAGENGCSSMPSSTCPVPSSAVRAGPGNKVRIGLEELEAGGQNMVDLVPAVGIAARHCRLDPLVPLGQRLFENLAVHRLLRREVMQQALAADSDLGDEVERVPSKPRSAKRRCPATMMPFVANPVTAVNPVGFGLQALVR